MSWMLRPKHVFALDKETCPKYGGKLRRFYFLCPLAATKIATDCGGRIDYALTRTPLSYIPPNVSV